MKKYPLFIVVCLSMLIQIDRAMASDKDLEQGFVKIFNGMNLEGWTYEKDAWTVKEGVLVGESKKHTFCRWDQEVSDFILKARFKITSGNSGIQYRSEPGKGYRMVGYQAEISNHPGDAGEMYGEGGRRHVLPYCGESVVIGQDDKRTETRKLADTDWKKSDYLKPGDWNEYTIVAEGNHVKQFINGHQTAELVDHGKSKRTKGLIGLQIHIGKKPMKVEFKDIRIKTLNPAERSTVRHGKPNIVVIVADDLGWATSATTVERLTRPTSTGSLATVCG